MNIAKDELQKIITIENEIMNERKHQNTIKEKCHENSILPMNNYVENEIFYQRSNILKELKLKFKSLVEEILKIRSKFHRKKNDYILSRKKTSVVSNNDGDITEYVKTCEGENIPSFNICIEAKKPFINIFIVLILISLVSFCI